LCLLSHSKRTFQASMCPLCQQHCLQKSLLTHSRQCARMLKQIRFSGKTHQRKALQTCSLQNQTCQNHPDFLHLQLCSQRSRWLLKAEVETRLLCMNLLAEPTRTSAFLFLSGTLCCSHL